MTCLKCCFWCLEKFIRFLNRNAYIMVSGLGPITNPPALPGREGPLFPVGALILPFYSLQIAIYGTNFCTSAKNAFFLLMRNIIRSEKTPPSHHLRPPLAPEPTFTPAPHSPLQSGCPGQSY